MQVIDPNMSIQIWITAFTLLGTGNTGKEGNYSPWITINYKKNANYRAKKCK